MKLVIKKRWSFIQVTIEGFNCWDGSVSFGLNMFDFPILQGVPDSVQAVGDTQLRAIEKNVYPSGKVFTSNEINLIDCRWKIGIGMGVFGIITSLVMVVS